MTIELLAPAKINLGLEVIGRREDGYHEIATIFQTISVFDRVRIDDADVNSVQFDAGSVQIENDLAQQALDLVGPAISGMTPKRISITKRIPVAAGLGGASADAAAVLAAIGSEHRLDRGVLAAMALQLGSDVPFLLDGGAAFATGRGEILERIPPVAGYWFVLACPRIALPRKTARLYGALTDGDFSDGNRVRQTADALRLKASPAEMSFQNAFEQPLALIVPEIERFRAAFAEAGAPFVALSGAGPTHYSVVPKLSQAIGICQRMAHRSPIPLRMLLARPVATGMQMRRDKTFVSSGTLGQETSAAPKACDALPGADRNQANP